MPPMSIKKNNYKALSISKIRDKLASTSGPQYWRSLEQVAESPDFLRYLQAEFPNSAEQLKDPLHRRRFLQLMGASVAFAGLSACTRQPEERIVPYVKAPEELIPGKPLYFASAFSQAGYGQGLLVESHDGRPTKIEGNPRHPASLGATSSLAQASILDLYDPDRIRTITENGRVRTWEAFQSALESKLGSLRSLQGEGLRILTGTNTSPVLGSYVSRIKEIFPNAVWHAYEPVNQDSSKLGSKLAFGRVFSTHYELSEADVIFSLDGDFFAEGPGSIRYTKDFMKRRRRGLENGQANRLYVAETTPTLTGTLADHKIVLRQSQMMQTALALASEVGVPNVPNPGEISNRQWIREAAKDLKAAGPKAVVIPGEFLSPQIHGLVHLINRQLGNGNSTVMYTESVESGPESQMDSLIQLNSDLQAGKVSALFILDGNPAYSSPSDLNLAEAIQGVDFSVYLALAQNETSQVCNWVIPQSHYLESWSDIRSVDGTVSIVQPLIEPMYSSKSALEILALLAGEGGANSYDLVRGFWSGQTDSPDFERWWRKSLHDGLIEGSKFETITPELSSTPFLNLPPGSGSPSGSIELNIRPDSTVYDGRHNNNGWLQELPKPLTKLTWDNAAYVSPRFAEENNLANQEVVRIISGETEVEAPVWIQPGHPDNTLTVHLGYGREEVGKVGIGTGFNAYRLTHSQSFWNRTDGIRIEKTGRTVPLACTQDHSSMEGRHLIIRTSLEELRNDPGLVRKLAPEPPAEADLYPGFKSTGHAWGMAVDLNACTGCNACVVACQSENNIAVVGKEQVLNGREMHWMRIDRYYGGNIDHPETLHQPVMCQHCENAPCESVCPVAATVHSDEGLNDMVYNRCVGTRYCSNNCPYKVRRFNFLLYSDWRTETLKLQRNPDVSVRSRGVMEKCTYCVQRINAAKIDAKLDDTSVQDGDIQTACQQVCPADAIVFGDINDPESRVSKLKESQRNYGILMELKTKPRTTYLAKIQNPNPEIPEEKTTEES
jgi:molybdopterin-containing oxidoreductase family iron-sulfur binding subunit